MTRVYISLLFSAFFISSYGQNIDRKHVPFENTCKDSWEYFPIKDSIYGEVLFHLPAIGLCGAIATASLTIVKTSLGDTIRVLEMCNVNKVFKKNEKVKVAFSEKLPFAVNTPPDDYYYCKIHKTCYGVITKLDN